MGGVVGSTNRSRHPVRPNCLRMNPDGNFLFSCLFLLVVGLFFSPGASFF